jgi:uncharacterized protein
MKDFYFMAVIILFMAGVILAFSALGLLKFDLVMTASQIIPLAALLLLVISPAEEFVFRGFLASRLSSSLGPVYGVLITSAFFGLIHFSKGWMMVLLAGISGIFLSLVFLRTKNIASSVILHFFLAFFYSIFVQPA